MKLLEAKVAVAEQQRRDEWQQTLKQFYSSQRGPRSSGKAPSASAPSPAESSRASVRSASTVSLAGSRSLSSHRSDASTPTTASAGGMARGVCGCEI